MNTINVNLGDRSYPIHIEQGLLEKIPAILSDYNHGQKWVIITQDRLMELFGNQIKEKLCNNNFECIAINIPTGEPAKSLEEYQAVVSKIIAAKCDRTATILALGGGVVGDVAGFVAATFMRGIEYFQIPTTLLAMVDSSIGGKTGINTAEGKNLIGAIFQPKGVLIDPDILQTLPQDEISAGLGEVIKYGAIWDKEFLLNVSSWLDNPVSFPLEKAIARSCQIKADVVAQDEREVGLRRILNFGHTIGHAIETHVGYGKIRHGEAVSYGMQCAGWISNQLGFLPEEEVDTLISTIHKLPLPKLPELIPKEINYYVRNDKKVINGVLHFVILEKLGKATTSDTVDDNLIAQSLKMIQ